MWDIKFLCKRGAILVHTGGANPELPCLSGYKWLVFSDFLGQVALPSSVFQVTQQANIQPPQRTHGHFLRRQLSMQRRQPGSMWHGTVGSLCKAELAADPLSWFPKQKSQTSKFSFIIYQHKFITILLKKKVSWGLIVFYFAVCGRGLFLVCVQTEPACLYAALRGSFWRLDMFMKWVVCKKRLCWPCTWSSVCLFIFSGSCSLASIGIALLPYKIIFEKAVILCDLCSVCVLKWLHKGL